MKPDGGPAFPYIVRGAHGDLLHPAEPGMTLRDWFAGQALAGLLASGADERGGLLPEGANEDDDRVAQWSVSSYLYADAMLAERAK